VTVPTTIDAGAWLGKHFEGADADTDLPRAMLAAFAEALMSAQASMQCGAGYNERTEERENSRNGYRVRLLRRLLQRCRTHFMVNLASRVPKTSWPMIATLVRSTRPLGEQPRSPGSSRRRPTC